MDVVFDVLFDIDFLCYFFLWKRAKNFFFLLAFMHGVPDNMLHMFYMLFDGLIHGTENRERTTGNNNIENCGSDEIG
jgi:hypothetical protein